MTAAADLTRGVVLDDRYRLEDVLGHGGMATVYRAHDVVLARDVAIKLFPPVAEDADDVLRHQAEMRVLAQMSHPGLVTLHDAGTAHAGGPLPQTFLVMELVNGPTLAELIARGPLTPQHTALLGRQLAEALAAVHTSDVVHRDVKPANVLLVDPQGLPTEGDGPTAAISTGPVVKLADFGIARLSDGARLTMTGTTLGTATYLSPEQAAGGAIGPPTDIYALGLVLLECLTGRKAFTGTVLEVAAARLNTAPPIPVELGEDWTDLLTCMTAREPADRISATEVALRLTEILQGVSSRESDETQQDADATRPHTEVTPPDGQQATPAAGAAAVVGTGSGTDADTTHEHAPVRPRRTARRALSAVVPPSVSVGSAPPPTDDAGLDRTRRYSTEEVRTEAERTSGVEADRPAVAPSAARRRVARRRPGRIAVAAVVLVGGGALLVGQLSNDTPDPGPDPAYPTVEGSMGAALTTLQESVEP